MGMHKGGPRSAEGKNAPMSRDLMQGAVSAVLEHGSVSGAAASLRHAPVWVAQANPVWNPDKVCAGRLLLSTLAASKHAILHVRAKAGQKAKRLGQRVNWRAARRRHFDKAHSFSPIFILPHDSGEGSLRGDPRVAEPPVFA